MRYRKYGLPGLARDDRSDRGWRRAITLELKEILEALAAKATVADSRFASTDLQDRPAKRSEYSDV
jgi:hypothetical protein